MAKRIWLIIGILVLLVGAGLFIFRKSKKPMPPPRVAKNSPRPAGLAGNGGFNWDDRGNLIVNGSFETPEIPPLKPGELPKVLWDRATADEMKPWETDGENFEIWANGLTMPRGNATVKITPVKSAVGNQNIEIISDPIMGDNGWKMTGAVWQTVKTTPGTSYEFSFFHSERPGAHSTLTVSLNSNIIAQIKEDGTQYGTLYWEQFETNFVADSTNTTVKFSDETDVLGQGTHLDGVLLRWE